MKPFYEGAHYRVRAEIHADKVIFRTFAKGDAPSIPGLGRGVGFRKRKWFRPFAKTVEEVAILTVMRATRYERKHEAALKAFDLDALQQEIGKGLAVASVVETWG